MQSGPELLGGVARLSDDVSLHASPGTPRQEATLNSRMSCGECDDRLAPTGPRKGEGHFAVRFGDHMSVHVFKDGNAIEDAYEVEAPDRAWRFSHPPRICDRCHIRYSIDSYLDESGGFSVTIAPVRGLTLAGGPW